jgi:hypothetical protein
MKKALLISCLFLLIFSGYAIEKDKFIIQFPIGITGDEENYLAPGYGINFGNHQYGDYKYKSFSWGVSPKAGYTLANNFIIGLDSKYWHSNHNGDNVKLSIYNLGLFIKVFFGQNNKIKPFLELEGAFGKYKDDSYSRSPGGAEYREIRSSKFRNLIGRSGCSYFFNKKTSVDLFIEYQKQWGKWNYFNTEKTKGEYWNLLVSFSVYL